MRESQTIDNKEFIFVIANIIGLNTLLTFPEAMVKIAGTAGWILCASIILFTTIFMGILYKLYEPFNGKDLIEIANFTWGRFGEILVGIIALFQAFIGGIVVAREFGESLSIIALPKSPVGFVIFLLMIGSGIAAFLGLKTISSVALITGNIILIGIPIILIGTISQINTSNFFPVLGNKGGLSIYNSITGLSWFSGAAGFFFLIPFLKDKKQSKKAAYTIILLPAFFMFITTFIYQGVVSYPGNTKQLLPLFTLSRSIKQGGNIERVEAVFLVIWVIAALIFISTIALIIAYILKRVFKLKYYNPLVLSAIVIIFSFSLMYKNLINVETTSIYYYRSVSWISAYLIPLILLIISNFKIRKQKKR